MKCSIKLHFTWVLTVVKNTCLGVSRIKKVNNMAKKCYILWVLLRENLSLGLANRLQKVS